MAIVPISVTRLMTRFMSGGDATYSQFGSGLPSMSVPVKIRTGCGHPGHFRHGRLDDDAGDEHGVLPEGVGMVDGLGELDRGHVEPLAPFKQGVEHFPGGVAQEDRLSCRVSQ